MTRLILPTEDDRIVTRMIYNIELRRAVRPVDTVSIVAFERPLAIEEDPPSTQQNPITDGTPLSENKKTRPDESAQQEEPALAIDWWAEARKLAQQPDEHAFKRWYLEQGYKSYVSIMQGPLPIMNGIQAKSPPTQEDATGYQNIYGDKEYKISENCVATTQVAARLDYSDFVQALPMIITCWPASKREYSFDRYDRD